MDKKAIYQQTQKVENELMKLKNTIFALQATDFEKHGTNYEELSTDAAYKAERLTCQLRRLVYMTDFTGKSDYLRHAAVAQGIHITLNNGILSVTLPALFPKRKMKSNTAFLHEPLNNLEFKQILDVISTYVLIDDSGQFCDLHHMTELGEEDHTVIHVMEQSAFPNWLSDHGNALKNISENS